MFSQLSERLSNIFKRLKNRGVLTPEIIDNVIREVRVSLLESDVALQVVKDFTKSLKDKLSEHSVINSVSPEQTISQFMQSEIVKLLGKSSPVAIKNGTILMCGLQGSGKTTTAAKLANLYIRKHNKKVMLVSLDVSRPAAVDQLNVLASTNEIPFFKDIDLSVDSSLSIAKKALSRLKDFNIAIFDTSGRMYIDESLMNELRSIYEIVSPNESLLVVDSMMGQDAVQTAKIFNENIKLTGLIMTKIDGDARGGACLSAKSVTNCQIRYMCNGEKIEDIEDFHPERVASRILDQGDIMSLIEKTVDQNIMNEDEFDLYKPDFDMFDMEKCLRQIEKIGGIKGILKFIPGFGKMQEMLKNTNIDNNLIGRQIAIIRSMTKKERKSPKILNASRRRRIAAGCGLPVCEVNRLVKQYESMRVAMNKIRKKGLIFS
ncbi:MAG: signal recognition particle protein Srp54 [Holosporales bacterium]|nr:signal recognition particle protein Srp54 [Holosporales bacterium]